MSVLHRLKRSGDIENLRSVELTELFRARDASCPKGKKMGYRKNLTNRDFSYSNKYNENILFNK